MNPSSSNRTVSSQSSRDHLEREPGQRRASNASATSSSSRPPSSQSSRPPSSLSSATRPLSRVSASRPPSRTITPRPPSAASSHRPPSRYGGNRPPSRAAASQRSRLLPHYQALVTNVTGANHDDDDGGERLRGLAEQLVKRLEVITANKPAVRMDMDALDKIISGIALKARVNLQDLTSDSLEHCYEKLKTHIENQENDLDAEIKKSRVPDHLQFLLALSEPPSSASVAYSDLYLENVRNPPPPPPSLTWADILAEEPFTGDHWEGILDPNVVKDDWDSTPSLSPLNSDDLALDDDDDSLSSSPLHGGKRRLEDNDEESEPSVPREEELRHPVEDPSLFKDLSAKQYWKKDWKMDSTPKKELDLGDPATLGPSFHQALSKANAARYGGKATVIPERYIEEEAMVREVLMALQGLPNIALTFMHDRFITSPSMPRLLHLTPGAQISILDSFARVSTSIQSIRAFIKAIFKACLERPQAPSTPSTHRQLASLTRTSEAFADAVDQELRAFDGWCASREEQICLASQGGLDEPLIVSFLATLNALSDAYDDSFDVILEVVHKAFDITLDNDGGSVVSTKGSAAAHATLLLDTLFSTLQEHTERNSAVVSQMLMRIFVRTAEPVWAMMGKWLRDGMGIVTYGGAAAQGEKSADLEEEFFIESSGVGIGMMSMGLLDPDFWKEGYCLREQYLTSEIGGEGARTSERVEKRTLVPLFLKNVAGPVLETGKAIGLVRVLGLAQASDPGFGDWQSFADVIAGSLEEETCNGSSLERRHTGKRLERLSTLFSVSVDSLSRVVYDRLSPVCESTGRSLVKIIVVDCELWRHINAVEDLFLMRRGDALSHFIDLVFNKMDAYQSWADIHFLNTAFDDVVRSTQQVGVEEWVSTSLVRFSHRAHREAGRNIHRSVKAIEGLQVEYSVPFPLTYIFRPDVVQKYSEVFVLLLQIRRAKSVLERILVRGEGEERGFREDLKVFYAMRSRLSWFVNTLLNFLTTHVLHVQILKVHERLRAARSLDEIIDIHDQHVDHIQSRCFLTPNTTVIHQAIISILDMCLSFSTLFTSFSGSTTATHDVSRASISVTLKHRSRRLRKQQRNVIGFGTADVSFRSSASSDEDDEDDELDEESFVSSASAVFEKRGGREGGEEGEGGDDHAFGKLERMGRELDGIVRYVRRGVEVLAGAQGDGADAFGVFAFALEDWDL